MTTDETDTTDPYPDSRVIRVEIEHLDGTVKRLEGIAATEWAETIDGALELAVAHGYRESSPDWEVVETGEDDE